MTDQSGHVLIVDSDQDVANVAQLVLTEAGFIVSVLVRADPDAVRTAAIANMARLRYHDKYRDFTHEQRQAPLRLIAGYSWSVTACRK